jgi:glyoxylase-like metal-dependent hydrolase (beta-lactamase superfamily II)
VNVVSLHSGVVVARSVYWQTTCTILHDGDETFIVDSPVFPEELEALPAILQQAGWSLSGLLATHADWDHLLARTAFPDASLGVAETSSARLRAEPGAAQRELRRADEELYVQRPPLSLGEVQALPVPGKLELGSSELELHPATGHTVDGMAVWAPFAGVLCPGDYISPVEIPMVEDSIGNYLATLRVLEPLVQEAEWVVPGHGGPIDAQRALAILREDVAYLEALQSDGAAAALPIARNDRRQKEIHAENVARL